MRTRHRFGIRPYARLLSMLGDQLIKDETIALVELIKNCYDADANKVNVSFTGFGPEWNSTDNSKIVIQDDGTGMTLETIRDAWMNPATPNKRGDDGAPKTTSENHRVMQGEKGIGRFAMLKLGYNIQLITRPKGFPLEYVVDFDVSEFGEELLGHAKEEESQKGQLQGKKDDKKKNEEAAPFLDELGFNVTEREPEIFLDKSKRQPGKSTAHPHGTRIEIGALRSTWNDDKVTEAAKEISKLQTIEKSLADEKQDDCPDDFHVEFDKDGGHIAAAREALDELATLCRERAIFRIQNGRFDNGEFKFEFLLNDKPQQVSFTDEQIKGLSLYRNNFAKKKREPHCGSFGFSFFIFDFSKDAPESVKLGREERNLIAAHRVYLYRDRIRVYPYGNRDDDWLGIDVRRGTQKAGESFSNDQLVGWINISKAENPRLKDKTNREGLINDSEGDTQDLINVVTLFLDYIFSYPYSEYKERKVRKKTEEIVQQNAVTQALSDLVDQLAQKGEKAASSELLAITRKYELEREELIRRAETTEDLAGIGLSVETASHDMMLMMARSLSALDDLIRRLMRGDDPSHHDLLDELNRQKGMLTFIESQMKDMQMVFRSSKQRARLLNVKDYLDKIAAWYARICKRDNIQYETKEIEQPVMAKCTEAVLLQLFINLFDNAIYWLEQKSNGAKRILITLDGRAQTVTFSDNGPGVHSDLAPRIFKAFVSGKGADGRGLGLYIAKQLLGRYDYSIKLGTEKRETKLAGANFVVCFVPQEDEE